MLSLVHLNPLYLVFPNYAYGGAVAASFAVEPSLQQYPDVPPAYLSGSITPSTPSYASLSTKVSPSVNPSPSTYQPAFVTPHHLPTAAAAAYNASVYQQVYSNLPAHVTVSTNRPVASVSHFDAPPTPALPASAQFFSSTPSKPPAASKSSEHWRMGFSCPLLQILWKKKFRWRQRESLGSLHLRQGR